MKFLIDKEKYIDSGLITEREHPTEPYVIYNYTPECQFSKAWDSVTVMCRGLIVHKETRDVIARPFPKFFNYEEFIATDSELPPDEPLVYDKRDGSLGILYFGVTGTPYIATRGSFVSEQAIWATEWFKRHCGFIESLRKLAVTRTFLFEIIYPENRIVINYGDYRGLDALMVINNETGRDCGDIIMINTPSKLGMPVLPIQKYKVSHWRDLKDLNTENKEGFVLYYPSTGLRLKIKFENYIALHKIMTGLSVIGIWEMLRDGKDILQIIGEIPDEMHEWVKGVVFELTEKFVAIENVGTMFEMEAKNLETRKEQAEVIFKSKYPSVSFAMLDGKNYQKIIWQMLRPRGSTVFRKDIDA